MKRGKNELVWISKLYNHSTFSFVFSESFKNLLLMSLIRLTAVVRLQTHSLRTMWLLKSLFQGRENQRRTDILSEADNTTGITCETLGNKQIRRSAWTRQLIVQKKDHLSSICPWYLQSEGHRIKPSKTYIFCWLHSYRSYQATVWFEPSGQGLPWSPIVATWTFSVWIVWFVVGLPKLRLHSFLSCWWQRCHVMVHHQGPYDSPPQWNGFAWVWLLLTLGFEWPYPKMVQHSSWKKAC